MRSLILRTAARHLMSLLLLLSVFLLLRGHDHPGGGFSGGLMAAGAMALYLLAHGRVAPHTGRLDARRAIAAGLVAALLSSLLPLLRGQPLLTTQWIEIGGTRVGSVLIFEIGVFLIVLGTTQTLLVTIDEETDDGSTSPDDVEELDGLQPEAPASRERP